MGEKVEEYYIRKKYFLHIDLHNSMLLWIKSR